jgi:hypothetical protein
MPTVDSTDSSDYVFRMILHMFRTCVEDGEIEIGDRSVLEIIEDYKSHERGMQDEQGDETPITFTIDHTQTLLGRVEDEANSGHAEIAIMFYALWIEHTVNGNLMIGLQRKEYDSEIVNLLIREVKLQVKITVLWRIAGFPQLSDSDVRLIEQVSQARNSFVHYKWPGYAEAKQISVRSQMETIIERSRSLKAAFDAARNALYWNGREEEVMCAFQADLIRHAEEVGPFIFGNIPPERNPDDLSFS